ncbi:elongation factor Ts, partial [Candidatus Peregrinibacteria bacterium]|nr:elongation factor Ts [Candidatus Peregrinibacteria bacterium]
RPEEAPLDLLVKEREIWAAQLAKEGKPQQIQEKIMLGKEKKFREEHALLSQPFAKDPSKTVGQYLDGAEVTAYVRLSVS